MSLLDELKNVLKRRFEATHGGTVCDFELDDEMVESVIADAMPIIERALAAERAATLNECERVLAEQARKCGPSERAISHHAADVAAIKDLPRNRSALAEALSQARREQWEKDATEIARAIEFAVEWTIKQLTSKEDWPASWDAGFPSYKVSALVAYRAAAIRAQEED